MGERDLFTCKPTCKTLYRFMYYNALSGLYEFDLLYRTVRETKTPFTGLQYFVCDINGQ